MRFVSFLFIILTILTFSCKSSEKKEIIKDEDNIVVPNYELTAEGYAIIIGRIHTRSFGSHSSSHYLVIEDENGTSFYIFPREKEEELNNFTECLMKFTVIVHDEPKGWAELLSLNGKKRISVTPIEWEIIEGSPVIPPKVTELGVIKVKGILRRELPPGPPYTIYASNGNWIIKSTEDDLSDYIDCEITVEGEGKVTAPASPIFKRFPFSFPDSDNEPEKEKDPLYEFGSFRELRNVKIIEVPKKVDKKEAKNDELFVNI